MHKEVTMFEEKLRADEKSEATIKKYVFEANRFLESVGEINRKKVLLYKEKLVKKFKPSSVNAAISAINSFLEFLGKVELKIKVLKVQQSLFSKKRKELTRAEYEKLLRAAKDNEKMYLLLQTITSTGMRVSELKFVTVESLKDRMAEISSND